MSQRFASYADMFRAATAHQPYPYQARIGGRRSLPSVIDIPPGYGKTAAVVLAWLWLRHFHPDEEVRARTPRRLVYALPMRTLSEQTLAATSAWRDRLGLTDEVALDLLIGGMADKSYSWRARPHRTQIIVGTTDMIVSRMLVRGYGSSRGTYPLDAALIWNDAHVVVDEVQLAPSATVTVRQIAAFQTRFGALRSGLTCMSATVDKALLETVDNPFPEASDVVALSDEDVTDALRLRRTAARRIRELTVNPSKPAELAARIVEHHRPGLTLVIVNTVATAVAVHQQLTNPKKLSLDTPITLLHSRFRPIDREPLIGEVISDSFDRIVIATQVVEAGMDLDARTLITEAAPWPSLIQRSGRCNRAGTIDDAELWWFAPARPGPYDASDLALTVDQLRTLEGSAQTNEQLLACRVPRTDPEIHTLRRDDFLSLFDTSPDLTGHDLDIAPYIRDSDDLDAQVVWMDFGDTKPAADLRPLPHAYRCRVPIGAIREIVDDGIRVWHFEQTESRWRTLHYNRRARPGEVLLIDVADGCYRRETGFDPNSRTVVQLPGTEVAQTSFVAGRESEPESDAPDSDANSTDASGWVPLDVHLEETAAVARTLIHTLGLEPEVSEDVVLAARLHDTGKAHPTWQNALRNTAAGGDGAVAWAKSPGSGRLRYGNGISVFRHEVASVALLDRPLARLLAPAHDPDLVRYLIAAHHGRTRAQLRNPEDAPEGTVLGLVDGEVELPEVLGIPAGRASIDLSSLRSYNADGGPSWEDTVTSLLDRYDVFRLAYFEMLVRIADWKASALHDQEATA